MISQPTVIPAPRCDGFPPPAQPRQNLHKRLCILANVLHTSESSPQVRSRYTLLDIAVRLMRRTLLFHYRFHVDVAVRDKLLRLHLAAARRLAEEVLEVQSALQPRIVRNARRGAMIGMK